MRGGDPEPRAHDAVMMSGLVALLVSGRGKAATGSSTGIAEHRDKERP
jgi:hypothetical protein